MVIRGVMKDMLGMSKIHIERLRRSYAQRRVGNLHVLFARAAPLEANRARNLRHAPQPRSLPGSACAAAPAPSNFYKAAFGAVEVFRMGDGDSVVARLVESTAAEFWLS